MPLAIIAIAIAIIGGSIYWFSSSDSTAPATNEETIVRTEESPAETSDAVIESQPETSPAMEPEEDTATTNPDSVGSPSTIEKTVTYLTPRRTSHELDITFTLEGDTVTAATVVYDNKAGFSNSHQERFEGAFRSQVIGKKLGDISLSRVGGASLTSVAFNEAAKLALAEINS